MTGGPIAPDRPLREPVIETLRRRGLEPRVHAEPIDAARGAATLARESATGVAGAGGSAREGGAEGT